MLVAKVPIGDKEAITHFVAQATDIATQSSDRVAPAFFMGEVGGKRIDVFQSISINLRCKFFHQVGRHSGCPYSWPDAIKREWNFGAVEGGLL
jgi:hypothetical protein|tara:strand:- start:2287 stop:2565 length:279 start_codon:yes stop_codon:yes gene_type:complete